MQKYLKAYNLVAALREDYANVTVVIISQQLATATAEEQSLLAINEPQSWIREVYLQGDGKNLVRGRVVVPYTTYQAYQNVFDSLGNKFLGESFLYKIEHTRSAFKYEKVGLRCQRQSIFYLNDNKHKLLVLEFFFNNH